MTTLQPWLRPGDRVAVLAPSSGLAGSYPHVYERGLRVLRDELELVPVEYPGTRLTDPSAQQRADDLHAAYADPSVQAVLSTIGGDDQITVLPLLDDAVLRANPKPFVGYSDNVCLLNHLFTLGLPALHGGSVMVHLGRAGGPHPLSMASLRTALFGTGWHDVPVASTCTSALVDWADPDGMDEPAPTEPVPGWSWHGSATPVEGALWGGCLEVLSWLLMAGRVEDARCDGGVLLIETSEEMPSADEVFRILRSMGERGLLARFAAILVGRPQTYGDDLDIRADQRRMYADEQRTAVLRALR